MPSRLLDRTVRQTSGLRCDLLGLDLLLLQHLFRTVGVCLGQSVLVHRLLVFRAEPKAGDLQIDQIDPEQPPQILRDHGLHQADDPLPLRRNVEDVLTSENGHRAVSDDGEDISVDVDVAYTAGIVEQVVDSVGWDATGQ